MAKNLLDVLKGTLGGGAGIKGDWDCTPVVGTGFSIVDSYRATYNAETKIVSADWSSIPSVTAGQPYIAMVKTDLTFGSIALDEVKKLSLQITDDIADPTALLYCGAFFLDSNTYSAETAATMLFNMLVNDTPLPKPNMLLLGANTPITGNGIGAFATIAAVTDGHPSGLTASAGTFDSGVDLSAAGAGDNITLFLSRTGASLPENGEAINIATAVFDSTGTMLSVGYIQDLPENPVLNSGMTMYIGLLALTQSGTVLPPASIGADITAGPNTATLSEITFTSGSLGFTQDDWNMVYATPATGFVPVIQAIFPLGAKKNDQFRVKIQPPATQGTPYGTVVTPEAVVVVDNVNPGQEAFRVIVDSAVLEARLAQLDFSAQIGALTALVDEAGRRAGEMVFYVRSTDPGVEPLVGPGVYDSFELAYEAAILQPKHIRKYIVLDDRSTNYRPTITFKTTGDRTWYLAANNIELSTVRAFDRIVDPRQVPAGDYPAYINEIVDVRGRFDALHFAGGAWAIAHGRDYNNYDPFCVPSSPSAIVETPSGTRRALEMGDNTTVMLSPLSYNLNAWAEAVLYVGDNCSLTIFTDVSPAAMNNSSAVMATFPGINNYDGYHYATPGRMTSKYGMTFIYAGNNFSFFIAYGTPEDGDGSFPVTVITPPRHHAVDFNTLTGCQHVVEGAGTDIVLPFINHAEKIAARAANIITINTKQDFADNATVYDDSGVTTYLMNANNTYLLTQAITFASNEKLKLGPGSVKFIGTGASGGRIDSSNYAGWLEIVGDGEKTFEDIALHCANMQTFYNDTLTSGTIVNFNRCHFTYTDNVGFNYVPLGTGSEINFNDCTTSINNNFTTCGFPVTFGHKVRFNRHKFDDYTATIPYAGKPIFDVANSTISGQLIFKDCEIRAPGAPAGSKRTLLSIKAFLNTQKVNVLKPYGLVVENCRKHWNDTAINGDRIIVGPFATVKNMIVIDPSVEVPRIRGKKVVNVFHTLDWPTRNGASDWVDLEENTIYRIHGNIQTVSLRHYLRNGTEIEGATGGMNSDTLMFGTGITTSFDTPLITKGDNWFIRNITLHHPDAGTERVTIACRPDPWAGTGQPAAWNSGIPANIDNVKFTFVNPGIHFPIKFHPADGVTSPDVIIGNIVVSSPYHKCQAVSSAPNPAIRHLTLKGITAGIHGGASPRQAQIDFGNAWWGGRVVIRDCELTEPPIIITGGVSSLNTNNRVTAFNNRGVTTDGLYGNALTTYVDGILMSNATLMLAQGNILGAPNSP